MVRAMALLLCLRPGISSCTLRMSLAAVYNRPDILQEREYY